MKQSSNVDMILETGTIVKKVKVGYKKDDEYLVTMLIKNSIHIEKVLPQFSELIKIIEVVNPRSSTYRFTKNKKPFHIIDINSYRDFQSVYIPTIINDILKSPPIRGCNIKRG